MKRAPHFFIPLTNSWISASDRLTLSWDGFEGSGQSRQAFLLSLHITLTLPIKLVVVFDNLVGVDAEPFDDPFDAEPFDLEQVDGNADPFDAEPFDLETVDGNADPFDAEPFELEPRVFALVGKHAAFDFGVAFVGGAFIMRSMISSESFSSSSHSEAIAVARSTGFEWPPGFSRSDAPSPTSRS